jgi:mono/diheme cytochrome c family protein
MLRRLALIAALSLSAVAARSDEPIALEPVTLENVEPILTQYCLDCHTSGGEEGGVALDTLLEDWKAAAGDHAKEESLRKRWEKVLALTRAEVMPPADMDQPTGDERERLAAWIKRDAFHLDPAQLDPGRVTLRRLNRTEYRNTVRDLMGVDYDAQADFPADGSGHGFDNVADVLTISPLHLEKYVAAAQEIVSQALPSQPRVVAEHRIPGGKFVSEGQEPGDGHRSLSYYEPATVRASHHIDKPGRYEVVVTYRAEENYVDLVFDQNKCRFRYTIDGEQTHEDTYVRQGGKQYEQRHKLKWEPGDHTIEFNLEPLTPDAERLRALRMDIVAVKVRGPLAEEHWVEPANYRKWFPRETPADPAERRAYAAELLGGFTERAFRRPPAPESVTRLVDLVEATIASGRPFEAGVAQAMTAVLASPRFLFREEADAPQTDGAADPFPLVDEYALASRLSYFMWSTMPDAELMRLASEGQLRARLDEQFNRLLNDPRSEALVRNFVGQWLGARDIQGTSVNAFAVITADSPHDPEREKRRARFRELRQKEPGQLTPEERGEMDEIRRSFDEAFRRVREFDLDGDLRWAMRRETEMTFEHVLREGRSVLELLNSDYTFLNERLARHYGIEGVSGGDMRRVSLPAGSPRGGVLTQGTVLVNTSNPDRTSPVKRGLFVLSNLVGTPPPPPPADVPALEAASEGSATPLTLRESLEKHRESPMCASCHARMDPLGLALEPFNALGVLRDNDHGKPIDATGTLVTGESFDGVAELKKILATERRQDFYRCLSEKLLTYALGRGVEYYDTLTVDKLVADLEQSGGDLRGLLRGVVDSAPFQRRRSQQPPVTATAQQASSTIAK